ncbi:hypothetical protein ACHAWF_004441, partial [Thalassiosira exigua]
MLVRQVDGNHIFQCAVNSKKMPHNFICNRQQQHMQPLLVTAGYIRPGAKLRRVTPGLIDSNKDLRPLDVSFPIDPMQRPQQPAPSMRSAGTPQSCAHLPTAPFPTLQ